MVDKVKPLKIESPATGGTQDDMFPTEANPAQDYMGVKGIALEYNDARLIDLDGSGNIQFKDVQETTPISVRKLRTALNNIFSNVGNGFIATNVQAAIEEARASAIQNDRYNVTAGYNGNANVGRYLEIFSGVGSDTAPLIIPETSKLVTVTLGATASTTATVGIFRTTDLVTPIVSFSLTAQSRAVFTGLTTMINANDELAIRVTAGSFNKPFMRLWVNTTT